MVEITQSIIISVISLVILFAGYKVFNKDCYVIHPIEETSKEYKSSYANNIELFKNVINMFITDNLDYNDGKFNFILNFKEITLKLDENALLYYILKSKVGTDSPNISSVKKLKKEIKPAFIKILINILRIILIPILLVEYPLVSLIHLLNQLLKINLSLEKNMILIVILNLKFLLILMI